MSKNGHKSVDLLAKAMRQVFKEAVEEGNLPLKREVKKLDKKVGALDKKVGTLESNLTATMGHLPEQISEQVNKTLDRRRKSS